MMVMMMEMTACEQVMSQTSQLLGGNDDDDDVDYDSDDCDDDDDDDDYDDDDDDVHPSQLQLSV